MLRNYGKIARLAAAEGIVMLKNDNKALPLEKGTKVAVFGRSQFNYYKSGTGSGGLVNTAYVVGILDALKASPDLILNEKVMSVYEEWLKENPFDIGNGWAAEPWCQKEMVPEEALVKEAAEESDAAVIILGRTAGEDKDNSAQEGSYLLNNDEMTLLKMVCAAFDRTIVLLNVGNIIDMKWVETVDPSAVLYVWQGGQEGGNAVLDVLTGEVSPSGKLADTIAYDIADYPSTKDFGDKYRNIYSEDIYVGYRYFETFAKDKVMYPFGFGLSYTKFDIKVNDFSYQDGKVTVQTAVTNIGETAGKEVVQLYCEAPQGALGKPARVLCAFGKTKVLEAGETQILTLSCGEYEFASYDDSGLSGNEYCYVLEKGVYNFHVGNQVRETILAGSFELEETKIIEKLRQALAPVVSFKRLRPDEKMQPAWEEAPLRTYTMEERFKENFPKEIPFTGDKGWQLWDVEAGKVSMEEFISQLSNEQLCIMLRGEGMCSPKVTPGTAGAFGGISEELQNYGIPAGCCADGPSGVRMDCGAFAFSLPNGTCLACTFNEELSMQLFDKTGLELRKNKVDTLLGPGMNLHRNPLNGRNFEYFSEDPFLTGKMAASQLKAMHPYQVTGTIKHFACNNQEYSRTDVESVVSERALREIYLKGYEIVVKEAGAYSIMSTYAPINGFWTASNIDLLTTILRGEWNFQGQVMTDWWAKGNVEGGEASRQEFAAMVKCQNDLYMVTPDPINNSSNDNLEEALKTGKLTRGELARSAMNLCNVLLRTPAFLRMKGIETQLDQELAKSQVVEKVVFDPIMKIYLEKEAQIPVEKIAAKKSTRNIFHIVSEKGGKCQLSLTLKANDTNPVSQLPVSILRDTQLLKIVTLTGRDQDFRTELFDCGELDGNGFYLNLFFGQSGLEISECKLTVVESKE